MMISKRYSPDRLGNCFIPMSSMINRSGLRECSHIASGPYSDTFGSRLDLPSNNGCHVVRIRFGRGCQKMLSRERSRICTCHVICDNASFHKSKDVRRYLENWRRRIRIHFLPAYSPEANPIERVWWHLHETITRNHRCKTMEELASLAMEWLRYNNNYYADMRNTFALAA